MQDQNVSMWSIAHTFCWYKAIAKGEVNCLDPTFKVSIKYWVTKKQLKRDVTCIEQGYKRGNIHWLLLKGFLKKISTNLFRLPSSVGVNIPDITPPDNNVSNMILSLFWLVLKSRSHGVTTTATAIDANKLHCFLWWRSHGVTVTTTTSQNGLHGYQ